MVVLAVALTGRVGVEFILNEAELEIHELLFIFLTKRLHFI
jgi:predicted ATP-grasp superfamily ATP-dependent carboligase